MLSAAAFFASHAARFFPTKTEISSHNKTTCTFTCRLTVIYYGCIYNQVLHDEWFTSWLHFEERPIHLPEHQFMGLLSIHGLFVIKPVKPFPETHLSSMEIDTSMAPAGATLDRQLTSQQPATAMAGQAAAAAGRRQLATTQHTLPHAHHSGIDALPSPRVPPAMICWCPPSRCEPHQHPCFHEHP